MLSLVFIDTIQTKDLLCSSNFFSDIRLLYSDQLVALVQVEEIQAEEDAKTRFSYNLLATPNSSSFSRATAPRDVALVKQR